MAAGERRSRAHDFTVLVAGLYTARWLLHSTCPVMLDSMEYLGYCAGSAGPAHLDERIDAFLDSFLPSLRSMTDDELDRHRHSLIAAKLQKDHTLADEADRNWEQISSKRHVF
jgi:hypothetical protein